MRLEIEEKLMFISKLIASPRVFAASTGAALLLIYLAVEKSFAAILMACKTWD